MHEGEKVEARTYGQGWRPVADLAAYSQEAASMSMIGSQLRYRVSDETTSSVPMRDARRVPFEEVLPFRSFPAYRGQKNMPGLYWCATMGRHVPCESRLETKVLTTLDFDSRVSSICAQPFELVFGRSGAAKKQPSRHVPDFFVRRSDGPDVVIDVKPARKAETLKQRRVFDLTKGACAEAGWDYKVAVEPDPVFLANLEWLCGFRRPPLKLGELAGRVLAGVLAGLDRSPEGRPLGVLVRELASGCPEGLPEAVYRPVVFHLLWRHVLAVGLGDAPLSDVSLLRLGSAGSPAPVVAVVGGKP